MNKANFIIDELLVKITSEDTLPVFPITVEVPSNLVKSCETALLDRERKLQIPLTEMIHFTETPE